MVIGHETIRNALKCLVDAKEFGHAYLFWGPSRIGKKTVALELARYLENQKSSYQVLIDCLCISPTAGSTIGIDEARRVTEFLFQKPLASPYKLAVIDDANCMTTEAQNALLKTAESPPSSGVLVLILPHPEMLRETLASRFQKIYFAPLQTARIESWLKEELRCVPKEAARLARESFGQPGRAYLLHSDKAFKAHEERARKLLTIPPAKKTDFVKKLVAAIDFNLETFLDAVIDVLTLEYLEKKANVPMWHKTLELRRSASYFNVNPRLQLEALLANAKP